MPAFQLGIKRVIVVEVFALSNHLKNRHPTQKDGRWKTITEHEKNARIRVIASIQFCLSQSERFFSNSLFLSLFRQPTRWKLSVYFFVITSVFSIFEFLLMFICYCDGSKEKKRRKQQNKRVTIKWLNIWTKQFIKC